MERCRETHRQIDRHPVVWKTHLEYFGLEITGLSSKTQTYMDDTGHGEQLQKSVFTQRLGCSTELEHGLKSCHPVNSRSWTLEPVFVDVFTSVSPKIKVGCIVGHDMGDNHSMTSPSIPAKFYKPPLSGRMFFLFYLMTWLFQFEQNQAKLKTFSSLPEHLLMSTGSHCHFAT